MWSAIVVSICIFHPRHELGAEVGRWSAWKLSEFGMFMWFIPADTWSPWQLAEYCSLSRDTRDTRRDVTRDVSQLWSRYELLWWRAGKLFMFELHDVTLDISLFIHPVTAINCYDASRVVNEICNILRMFSKRSWNFVEIFRCEAQSCLAYMPCARRRNISLAAAPRLVGG